MPSKQIKPKVFGWNMGAEVVEWKSLKQPGSEIMRTRRMLCTRGLTEVRDTPTNPI